MPTPNGTASPIEQIAYLGPPLSFSHAAALAVFPTSTLTPFPSFTSIFAAVQSDGTYTYAVLPIENSTNGSVVQVLDLLAKCPDTYQDLEVCGEYYLPVHHFLYANTTASTAASAGDIKTIYTHPQVWGQCMKYLSSNLPPPIERIDVSSTSRAAVLVSADKTGKSAAICSSLAGEASGLYCLASNIEDEVDGNTTRFLVLRNRRHFTPSASRASSRQRAGENDDVNVKSLITFTVPHSTPGSLSSALRVFAVHDFNLTRIDTRPSGQISWHYIFFCECEERQHLGTHKATAQSDREMSDGEGAVGNGRDLDDLFDQSRLTRMVGELKDVTERVWVGGSWVI